MRLPFLRQRRAERSSEEEANAARSGYVGQTSLRRYQLGCCWW